MWRQAHECLEVNRCIADGQGFSTADERQRQAEARRFNANCVFISAMAGVAIAVVENELRWQGELRGGSSQGLSTALKGLVLGSTLVTFFFLYQYYDAAIALRRLSNVRVGSGVTISSLRGAGLLWDCLFQVAIMLPQPLPGVDNTLTVYNKGIGKDSVYDMDSVMCLAMFVRLAYLPRYYGEVLSELRSDAALAISRMNSVVLDDEFVVKYVLANSLTCVVGLTALLIIMFAYMLMVFERPVDNGTLGHYANCIWLIIITMTTVGYGDEFPVTVLGRVIGECHRRASACWRQKHQVGADGWGWGHRSDSCGICVCVCAAVMASLAAVVLLGITTNIVVSKLTLSRSEVKVLEVMDTIALREDLRDAAAVVIQVFVCVCVRVYVYASMCVCVCLRMHVCTCALLHALAGTHPGCILQEREEDGDGRVSG